ncbi:hypothetical protein EVAR_79889_1 [Eumeta japonica]|uniref:RNA-directed DNA polymerase from mobile element jockey n=1 Tax=Eumeta variegata TaxID=151549 RepID=A0A4C1TZ07_EUMVA|nr:hypothetical protein EVAR_79889_1 [Eumeta japonica]
MLKKSTLLRLQRAIDELSRCFCTWRIKVNPENSAVIQFKYSKHRSRQIVDLDTPHLRMSNANIPWQFNYQYLGVMLDKNLHFKDHIECVRKIAIFYRARLRAMPSRKSKLSRHNERYMQNVLMDGVDVRVPGLRSRHHESTG